MTNETVNQEITKRRDITVVTAEIKDICAQARRMMLIYAIEVGRRLVEAKEILPHGEWGDWLKNEVEFSQDTANNHMKLFEAYGSSQYTLFGADLNSETFRNLSYTQALKLLAVPDEEREAFAKANDIEHKSVREIDKLIKERDEALKCAEGLKNGIDDIKRELDDERAKAAENAAELYKLTAERKTLADDLNNITSQLDILNAELKKSKAMVKELKANPEIPDEKLKELRDEIAKENAEQHAAELEDKLADIKKKLEAAEAAEVEAKRTAENAAGRIAELEKKLKISDPSVARFRVLLKSIQDNLHDAIDALNDIKDEQTADGLRRALRALAKKIEE